MSRLLLVEDEIQLGEAIRKSLSKMGFECDWVKTLREGRDKMNHETYVLMILDRNLPDGEGTQLLRHPRRKGMMALILSSKSSVEHRVEGLRKGADDYLPKPFSFQELEARIHALIRRRPSQPGKDKVEMWKLSEETLTLECETGEVVLTPLEFKFMKYLLERKGSIVSKDRLLRDVWGFSFLPKTRTIDYLITQLRKRIELDPEHPKHLLTVRGAGVKFEV
jgi:DNA-binding response OmpR family regulator